MGNRYDQRSLYYRAGMLYFIKSAANIENIGADSYRARLLDMRCVQF